MHGPPDSPYEEGIFGFRLFLDDFPTKMPVVKSLLPILHMNIENPNVCTNSF
jgi:ubiquitin-protein ligase